MKIRYWLENFYKATASYASLFLFSLSPTIYLYIYTVQYSTSTSTVQHSTSVCRCTEIYMCTKNLQKEGPVKKPVVICFVFMTVLLGTGIQINANTQKWCTGSINLSQTLWSKSCASFSRCFYQPTSVLTYWPIDMSSAFFCKKMDHVDYPAWTGLACKGFGVYIMNKS